MKSTRVLIVILAAASLTLLGCGKSEDQSVNAKGSTEEQAAADPNLANVAPGADKSAEAAMAVVTEEDFEEEADEINKDNLEQELKKIEDEMSD